MNTTLRQRSFRKDSINWTIEVREVRGTGTICRQANLKRNGETWGCVQLKHNGQTKTIPLWPAQKLPHEVAVEVNKDLGVANV